MTGGDDDQKTRQQLIEEVTALRAERASLLERVASLEAVCDFSDEAMYLKDAEGRYAFVNGAGARFVNKSVQEVVGRRDSELFPPGSTQQINASDREILDRGVTISVMQVVSATDATRTYLTTKGPYRDDRGRVIGVVGSSRDITESKRIEERLRTTQEFLTRLLDHSPALIYISDRDGRLRLVNRAWEELWRQPREEVIGRMAEELFPPQRARLVREQNQKVIEATAPTGFEEIVDVPHGPHHLHTVKLPLRDAAGHIENVGGISLDLTDRRRTELRQTNRRSFQALFDNTLDAIWLVDDEGHFLEANPAACTLLGYSREEFSRMTIEDVVPVQDRQRIWKLFDTFVAEGQLRGDEYLVRKDGSVLEIDYRAVAHILPGLHLAVGCDITEMRRVEAERDQLLRHPRLQIDRLPLAYLMFDADNRVLEWNPAAERIFGYTKAEVLGRVVLDLFVPPSAQDQVQQIIRRLRVGDMDAQSINENLTKDGRLITCQWFNTPLTGADGRFAGVISLAKDITERTREEEILARDAQVLAGVRDAVMVTDLEGIVEYWNEGATKLFGWRAEEVLGQPMTTRVPEAGRAAMTAEIQAIAAGKDFSGEWQDYRKDGSRIWIDARVTRINDAAGRPVGLIGVCHDISDRKRAEEALRDSERRLTMALQAAGRSAWEWDIATNRTVWTEENARLLGNTPGEVASTFENWIAAIHPEDRAITMDEVERAVKEKRGFEIEYRVRWPDGTTRWIRDFGRLELDSQHQPTRMQGILVDITEHKRTEEALRESEEQFRFLAESIPHMVWTTRPDGSTDYYNARSLDYLGVTLEQTHSWDWALILHPDDRQRTRDAWAQAVRTGAEYRIEYRIRNASTGEYRWFLGHALPHRAAGGQVVRWLGTCTDIDERKQAEQELRRSEEQVRLLLDSTAEGIYGLDLEGRCTFSNAACLRLLGYSDGRDLVGKDMHLLVHHSQADVTSDSPQDCRVYRSIRHAEEVHVEDEVLWRADGTSFAAEYWSYPIRRGREIIGAVVAFVDISRRKRVEEELRTLNAALENAVEGIARLDTHGRYLSVNRACAELLGYRPEEMIGMDWERTVRPEDLDAMRAAHRRMQSEGRADAEVMGVRRDGSTFWTQTVLIQARDERGAWAGHHCFMKDVTQRKRGEAALRRHAARARVLSQRVVEVQEEERRHLARELHDEIGQILTAISINLNAIKRTSSAEVLPRLEECIGIVDDAIEQVQHLSLDLRPAMLDELGLVPTLRWYVDRQAQRVGYQAHFAADPDEMRLRPTMATAVFRVAQEALTNVARHAQARRVRVTLRLVEGALRLVVRDDGVGFDPKTTLCRGTSGRGLGLLGMRERASLLGGRVAIRSTPGRGTHTRLTLPLKTTDEGG